MTTLHFYSYFDALCVFFFAGILSHCPFAFPPFPREGFMMGPQAPCILCKARTCEFVSPMNFARSPKRHIWSPPPGSDTVLGVGRGGNWQGDWCYNVSGNEGVKLSLDNDRFARGGRPKGGSISNSPEHPCTRTQPRIPLCAFNVVEGREFGCHICRDESGAGI